MIFANTHDKIYACVCVYVCTYVIRVATNNIREILPFL